MSILFSCNLSRNKAGGGFGGEQCWVVLWTLNGDLGCIASNAQSTAATCFIGAVKSDVDHLIIVWWVLLLQSFGAEQIGHTRLPTNIFGHACVEIPFSCILSRNKAGGGFGHEQCWVILWIPNEEFGCITSHAQSTAATYSPVRLNLTLFTLSWYAGCSCCSLLELNRLVTLGGQQT